MTPQEIIKKYGANIPPCKYVKAVDLINSSAFNENKASKQESLAKSNMANLLLDYPQIYGMYFRGTPESLKGTWKWSDSGKASPEPEFAKGPLGGQTVQSLLSKPRHNFLRNSLIQIKLVPLDFLSLHLQSQLY